MLRAYYLHLIDINHLMHYITMLLAHSCAFAIDHTEQAQAKDLTSLALDQGKPQCI
jgi:hypothetical protein